ncbi:hypothetical protein ANCCAN_28768 [Ancylostoma caninum]|uniref:Glycosyltransferase family 92 protein n=1 Tax=Ancylostoma caninum TaxID=29170 RepID=A0A368F3C8_ANCCA|nr:hypothetical protein ANCCAN_28768 [Ancylostoma caninum]
MLFATVPQRTLATIIVDSGEADEEFHESPGGCFEYHRRKTLRILLFIRPFSSTVIVVILQVYSYYGAAMHFYVRSMITDLFSILSRYPNARVNPWAAIQLGSKRANSLSFDPNLELEFRNQAAAMTDCLLLYKESAKFIIFPDTDDIIIPRLGRTYLEEFQKVLTNYMSAWQLLNVFLMYPDAAAVAYNMSQSGITSSKLMFKVVCT